MNEALPVNKSLPKKLEAGGVEILGEGVRLIMPRDDGAERPFHFGIFSIDPNTTSPIDHHRVSEIWYITSGSGKLIANEAVMNISAGEFVQIDSCIPHSIVNESNGESLNVVFAYWSQCKAANQGAAR